MTEFDIGKFKYTWKGTWGSSALYKQDDIVYYNGSSWCCLTPHTSSDFYTDYNAPISKWKEVTSGLEYCGIWVPNTVYEKGSVVTYNYNVYVSLEKHSASTFQTNKWLEWLSSLEFKGNWQSNLFYEVNDVVRFGSSTFKCITAHSSATFDIGYWEVNTEVSQFKGFFVPNDQYSANDVVSVNRQLYLCLEPTSSTTFENNKWQLLSNGSQFVGEWSASTVYVPGDIVKLGGTLFYCTNNNIGQKPFNSSTSWRTLSTTAKFKGEWAESETYNEGDAVRRGSNVYIALYENTNQFDSSNWKLVITGYNWRGSWEPGNTYYKNENVFYRGSTYTCVAEHVSSYAVLPSESPTHWNLALSGNSSGLTSVGEISVNTNFGNKIAPAGIKASTPGEVLSVGSSGSLAYTQWNDNINVRFVSPSGVDRSDFGTLPSQPWKTLRYACKMVEALPRIVPVTIKVANGVYYETLPITVPANTIIQGGGTAYSSRGTANSVRIVPSIGVSDPTAALTQIQNSITFFKNIVSLVLSGDTVSASITNPYTQSFAQSTTEFVNSTVQNLLSLLQTHVSIRVDEKVTSTPTLPNQPTNPIYKDPGYTGYDYLVDQFSFVNVHSYAWKTGLRSKFVKPVLVSPGTQLPTVDVNRYYAVDLMVANLDCWFIDDPFLFRGPLRNKFIGNVAPPVQPTVTPVKYNSADYLAEVGQWVINEPFLYSVSKFKTIIDKQVFKMGIETGGGQLPSTPNKPTLPQKENPIAVYGSPVANNSTEIINSKTMLELNRDFIKFEFVNFVTSTYGSWIFSQIVLDSIANELITAIVNDLTYSSNYYTQSTAHYISVIINGSYGFDMFRLQNGSVLESLSLYGLEGQYSSSVLTKHSRPQGGAYISLDPGFGTNDSKVWITTTPPIVSNVNMIGSKTIGVKVDGGIHSSGLKTIQLEKISIINDQGIGIWACNSGQVVANYASVMYSLVSSVAETGSSITSFSSVFSYGKFGAFASGKSSTEVPSYAQIVAKQTPIIGTASFLNAQDQIIGFEFKNNGTLYSQCTGAVTGAGRNARVEFEEFLNNSVYQVQVHNPGSAVELFTGYCISSTSNTVTINSPSLLPSQIENLRLVIESGPGAGQYGVISSYNFTSKTASIVKESTNTPGWDTFVPGSELTPLTNESRFRIEPRVVASLPPFLSETKTIQSAYSVISSVTGKIKAIYNSVLDTSSNSPASFNVSKYGKTYTVTLDNPGSNYTVGSEIVILGSQLGGVTPQNDLKIVVTKVNDFNSIAEFSYSGVGAGTVSVMTTDTNIVLSSTDGNAWTETTMPEDGRWEAVAYGGGKFVSVGFNTAVSAVSSNGRDWVQGSLPSRDWISVTYGNGIFVAVAQTGKFIARSTDGISWIEEELPVSGLWKEVTYGNNKFVFVSSDSVVVGTYNNGFMFQLTQASTYSDQVSCAYGSGQFVILSESGRNFFSANGITWSEGQSIANGSIWKQVRYGNGIFLAISTTPVVGSNVCAVSDTRGVSWELKTLSTSAFWETVVFADFIGSQSNTCFWLAMPSNPSTQWNKISAGARYVGRAVVKDNRVTEIKTWNPGSGYLTAPTISVLSKDSSVQLVPRVGNGTIAQPVITNQGNGYRLTSTRLNCVGNGLTIDQVKGTSLVIKSEKRPVVGGVIRFSNGKEHTITKVKPLLNTTEIEVLPNVELSDNVNYLDSLNFFNEVSLVRLNSHIFDSVGTGGIEETSTTGTPNQLNNVFEELSGRVLHTSLSELGVFAVGKVFSVDQQQNLITMSADAYGIEYDDQLIVNSIKGVSGALITEFSNDQLMTANSDSIVPTQYAIKQFIANSVTANEQDLTSAELSAGDITFTNSEIISNSGSIVVNSPSIVLKQSSGMMFANMFYQSGRI